MSRSAKWTLAMMFAMCVVGCGLILPAIVPVGALFPQRIIEQLDAPVAAVG